MTADTTAEVIVNKNGRLIEREGRIESPTENSFQKPWEEKWIIEVISFFKPVLENNPSS